MSFRKKFKAPSNKSGCNNWPVLKDRFIIKQNKLNSTLKMKKNFLLTLADWWFKISAVLVILSFLYLTGLLITYHLNLDYFENKHLNLAGLFGGQAGYTIQDVWHVSEEAEPLHPFAVKNVKPFSLYLVYLQFSAIFFCSFMVFKEGIKIIRSVKKVESFKVGNVSSLKRMGKHFFFIFLLSGFAFVAADNGQFMGVFFNFTAFSLMAGCYIMAEIFKEGNVLQEEIQNTI